MSNPCGDQLDATNATWRFTGDVPHHFDTHVMRSIPFYRDTHTLILALSDYFIGPDSLVMDLGCATGTLTQQLGLKAQKKNARIIGIDAADDMIAYAKKNQPPLPNVDFQHHALIDLTFEPCDVIIAHYTLQFTLPKQRHIIIDRIYDALNWGGGFILFEKVRAPDARFQDMMTGLYTDYKLAQGYNANQIINKARSLKQILEPFSSQGNYDLLTRAGFTDIMTIFKHVCFEGFLAIK